MYKLLCIECEVLTIKLTDKTSENPLGIMYVDKSVVLIHTEETERTDPSDLRLQDPDRLLGLRYRGQDLGHRYKNGLPAG